MTQLSFVKKITALYITASRGKVKINDVVLTKLADVLIDAKEKLPKNEFRIWEEWHQKRWPNLDW